MMESHTRFKLSKQEHGRRYKQFLAKLKEARRQSGLTQIGVSSLLSRPQSFVSKCESGERRVDVIELMEFAEIYHKPISFFLAPS